MFSGHFLFYARFKKFRALSLKLAGTRIAKLKTSLELQFILRLNWLHDLCMVQALCFSLMDIDSSLTVQVARKNGIIESNIWWVIRITFLKHFHWSYFTFSVCIFTFFFFSPCLLYSVDVVKILCTLATNMAPNISNIRVMSMCIKILSKMLKW